MRRLIKTSGESEEFGAPLTIWQIASLLGADTTDCVILRHMGEPRHVMVVDDHGWEFETVKSGNSIEVHPLRPLKPINAEATALYLRNCLPGTTHQIAGDVFICPDSDFGSI